jgi:nitroreductase
MHEMDFLEFAKRRSSVRNFTSEKIDEASIAKIVEAGRIAPTAGWFIR